MSRSTAPLDSYLAHRLARFTCVEAPHIATRRTPWTIASRRTHEPRNEFFWQDGPYHDHDAWWTAPLHALFVLLLVALLVVGVIWLVRRLSPGVSQAATPAVAPAGALAVAGDSDRHRSGGGDAPHALREGRGLG